MKKRRAVIFIMLAFMLQACGTTARTKAPGAPSLPGEMYARKSSVQPSDQTAEPGASAADPTQRRITDDPRKITSEATIAIGGGKDSAVDRAKSKVPPIPAIKGKVTSGLVSPAPEPKLPTAGAGEQEKQRVVLNYDKADVAEVTNQIFGDYLKLNYVLDGTLQGRISMYLEGEFTRQEFLNMIVKAYEANNISIVPKEGIYHVQPLQRSSSSTLPIANAAMLEDKGSTRPMIVIYRLAFMDAKQAINTLRFFLTPGRPITSDPMTNTVIFVESSDNAATVVQVLRALDVDILQEVSMEIVPLQALTPQDAVQNVEALMGKMTMFKETALGNSLAFIPLSNFGGVLVLARSPEMLKTAKYWLTALDVRGQETGEQIYVYFVQNALAADIGNILTQLFGLGGGTGTTRPSQQIVSAQRGGFGTGTSTFGSRGFGSGSSSAGGTTSGSSPQFSASSGTSRSGSGFGTGSSGFGTGTSGLGTGGAGASRTGALGGSTGGAGGRPGQPGQPTMFTGEVVIIPDEVNNAIVTRANAQDYAKIKKTMESLDIVPRAVLVEVLVAEIRLTKDLQFGLQWFFRDIGMDLGGKSGSLDVVRGTPSNRRPRDFDPTGNGLNLFWGTLDGKIGALINLLSQKTDVNILQTPTLLASDNKEASITVGGRDPIAAGPQFSTGTSVDVGGDVNNNIVSSIQYEETGLMLNIIPHINAGGLIRLEVDQTIRNVADRNVVIGSRQVTPSFTERNIKTTILAQNGSTVVMGGIINQQDNKNDEGVPGLQRIPLLSPFFSSKNNHSERTELLIAITPHIVDHSGTSHSREFLNEIYQLKRRVEQR